MNLQDVMNQAVADLRANRLAEAEKLFRELLAERPTAPDALHLLGCTLSKSGRTDEALDLINRAITLSPQQAMYHNNLGMILFKLGRKQEGIQALSQAVKLQPNSPGTLNILANALMEVDDLDQAIACLNHAIQLQPNEAGLVFNLGNCWYRKGTRISPATNGQSSAVQDLNNAVVCFQRALAMSPTFVDAANNLGNTLRALGRMDDAIAMWRRAVSIAPHYHAFYNLGRALYERDLLDEAREAMQNSLQINQNDPDAHNNLGNVFRQSGKVEQAIAEFDRALEIDPKNALANSNRLYTLYYDRRLDAKALLEHHRLWNEKVVGFPEKIAPHENDRSPTRRLKIGYVSPNFWGHCQSLFTMPLLSNHDRANFEIYCYSDVKTPDAMTGRLQGMVDGWRSIAGLSNDRAAELIRKDGIDILVDLTLHMAENRILLFAQKPAPVQVTWLGYPGTTGLAAMDYRLTDPYLDPPGEADALYTEKSVRLPHTFWCLDPAALEAADIPAVNDLPASKAGHITFGCLNNFCKVNQPLLDLWKRVLDAVAGSRMIQLAPRGSCQQWVREILGDRVDFVERNNRAEYLKYYHRIDMGLDTLPYNGHTTTLDSMWMGVPVVTLVGQTVVGRAGLSQLSNLGLTELATTSPERFVECAVQLAGDLPRLTELRRTLREQMRQSPLLDGAKFAADVEAAYRGMWREYCQSV